MKKAVIINGSPGKNFNTAQFDDYSKYDSNMFDAGEKLHTKETQFPKDLEKAFELGRKPAGMKK